MPSTTTHYGLHIYNTTTDKTQYFEDFRDNLAGVGSNSNMVIIDSTMYTLDQNINDLATRKPVVKVPFISDNIGNTHFSATGVAGITGIAYEDGTVIAATFNENNGGATEININTIGNKFIKKINSSGSLTDLAANDFTKGRYYLFIYVSGDDVFIWIGATSADQIHTSGTTGDFVAISSTNMLQDSGISLDTDGTLAANSDTKVPSQKAAKTYIDNVISVANALVYKGTIDCSGNPNYPAADAGWMYLVSVAGKIGGASGINVEVGDMLICTTDGTPSGNQATVGAYWNIIQKNIDGSVTGPASATDKALAIFDGTSGKIIANGVAPGASGNALISNGTTWTSSVFTDSNQVFSDITTNNASTVKHGFLPKLSGSITDVLRGNGTFGRDWTSFRNRIINGAMEVDQRNNGASQTITAAAALAYTIDRWYAYCEGADVTGEQVSGTSPNLYNYRFTGASSVTKIGFSQRIEQINSQDMAGQTATLSVDLANSLLTTVTWKAWYANTADTFGTLASPTRTQIATGTFTVTSTLTRYSTNISIPSAATTGIEIELSVGAQTSGTWTIGRFQFEIGSSATDFERRPYGLEKILCQRYFNRMFGAGSPISSGVAYSTTTVVSFLSFPDMRISPTIKAANPTKYWLLLGGPGILDVLNIIFANITARNCQMNGYPASTNLTVGQGAVIFNGNGNGLDISFYAEL